MAVSTPRSLSAALAALAEYPDALVLAGGTDAVVEINAGHRRPTHVVAVDRVAELRTWRVDAAGAFVHIGAGVPFHELVQGDLAVLVPALAQASRTVGSPQIRQVGTLGGNLGTCSPAGDALPVLAALEAQVHLASAAGTRSLPFATFMTGVKRNARHPGELITGVTLPVLDGWQGYSKVGVRNAMVIATASCCLAVHRPARSVRVALGSVGPVIIRATGAETWLAGEIDWAHQTVSDSVVSEFGARCAAASRPIDDHRSTAAYRRQAVGILARRQLRRAFPDG